MGNTTKKAHPECINIYTLGHNGTNIIGNPHAQPNLIVHGKGTDYTDKRTLTSRAKRKMKTQYLTTVLADIAKSKGDNKRAQAYWNAWHCVCPAWAITRRLESSIRLIARSIS